MIESLLYYYLIGAVVISLVLAVWVIMREQLKEGHMSPVREHPLLLPSSKLSWLALTQDQARILYQVVRENRTDITRRWSPGIFDGLSTSLRDVDRAGGAYIRKVPGAT